MSKLIFIGQETEERPHRVYKFIVQLQDRTRYALMQQFKNEFPELASGNGTIDFSVAPTEITIKKFND